jgi:type II secretory pathway pseudopilin PulG
LIELAVGLVVTAILLASILVPLNTQVEERQVSGAEKAMESIREALLGFAAVNGYLPCPDIVSSNDGVEDFVAGTGLCSGISGTTAHGSVPWASLGLSDTRDPWGNRYRYAVIAVYAQRSPATAFSLSTSSGASSIRVCATAACATQLVDATINAAVAVVISHGGNGWGAINSLTNAANAAPTSADELENTDGDTDFVYRTRTGLGATAGEYDDVVTWLSRSVLMNRMVAAGKLP